MTLETIAALGNDTVINLPIGQCWSGGRRLDVTEIGAVRNANQWDMVH